MLGKLIKYEFKANSRILLPIYAALFIISIISGLLFAYRGSYGEPLYNFRFYNVLTLIFFVLFLFGIFSCVAVSYFMSIYRFKKNIFDTEGYLTNTLPVSTSYNIFSKLIVASIYQVIGLIVASISGSAFLTIAENFKPIAISTILKNFIDLINEIISTIGVTSFVFLVVEVVIFVVFVLACQNLMFYSSLSVGYSANKHKTAYSICAFVGFYLASQIINSIILTVCFQIPYIARGIAEFEPHQIHYFMWIIIGFEAIYSVIYYLITHYYIKNKLNLQ